jgi:predicted nucleic acid-binding protein
VNRWRVVLDTNVLISAYRFGGKPQSILLLAQSGAFLPLTSTALRIELSDVLNVKFHMEDQAIRNLCDLFERTIYLTPLGASNSGKLLLIIHRTHF